jgi:hypothetical protein
VGKGKEIFGINDLPTKEIAMPCWITTVSPCKENYGDLNCN